jgi:hypothetical protein
VSRKNPSAPIDNERVALIMAMVGQHLEINPIDTLKNDYSAIQQLHNDYSAIQQILVIYGLAEKTSINVIPSFPSFLNVICTRLLVFNLDTMSDNIRRTTALLTKLPFDNIHMKAYTFIVYI